MERMETTILLSEHFQLFTSQVEFIFQELIFLIHLLQIGAQVRIFSLEFHILLHEVLAVGSL